MTHIDVLKAEIREMEAQINAVKRELARISAEFSESNDQLGQLHLSKPIATES